MLAINFMDQSLEFRSHFVHFPHHFSEEMSKKFIINRIFELPKRCSKSLCIHILKNHISSRLIWFWSFPLFPIFVQYIFSKFSGLSHGRNRCDKWETFIFGEQRQTSKTLYSDQRSPCSERRENFKNKNRFRFLIFIATPKCSQNIRWNLESRFEGCSFALARAFLPTFAVPLKQNRNWYDYAGQMRSGIWGRFWIKNTRRTNKKRKFTEAVCDFLFLPFKIILVGYIPSYWEMC